MDMTMSMTMEDSMFANGNATIARTYWYIICGVLVTTAMLQVVNFAQTSIRLVFLSLESHFNLRLAAIY